MTSGTVLHVVGARPNFMKVAPLMRALAAASPATSQVLVHTGQHYSPSMSAAFFADLDLPQPDYNLEVGSGSHGAQTAEIMRRFEPLLERIRPAWVVVPGDVNSTLACALVAAKARFRVAHLEAGLRSRDRSMPEELNRILTDHAADLLLTPSRDADLNLLSEGVPPQRIRCVGNVMIDTLVRLLPRAEARWRDAHGLGHGEYVLVTMHRPATVDDPTQLQPLLQALQELARTVPILFPVHPRTRARMSTSGGGAPVPGLKLLDPQGYIDFLGMMKHAALVVTDSGGIQEETTYLGVPCLTYRDSTERPITVEQGTNRLLGQDPSALLAAARECLAAPRREPPQLEYWDGFAGERAAGALLA